MAVDIGHPEMFADEAQGRRIHETRGDQPFNSPRGDAIDAAVALQGLRLRNRRLNVAKICNKGLTWVTSRSLQQGLLGGRTRT